MVGDYELVRPLDERGGMSVVYLARDTRLGREAAVKQIDLRLGDGLGARFLREARLAGALNHPNVVTVFDYFEADGVPYIAMEFLEHGSLRGWMPALTRAQVLGVLEGILAGLSHAHDEGVVHGDIKPENVLVTGAGAVKLADFGIAKAYANVTQHLTGSGAALGTPVYISPEQALAQPGGPAADLYSTGVLAFELLLGRPPFPPTESEMALLLQHVNEPVPDPRMLDPELDPRLALWLLAMLAKDPSARPPGARQAWSELERIAVDAIGPSWRREARLLQAAEVSASAPIAGVAATPPPRRPLPRSPSVPGLARVRWPVDEFAAAGEAAWALHWGDADGNDRLSQLEWVDGRIYVESVDLGGNDFLDVTTDGDAVWLMAIDRVLRLDPFNIHLAGVSIAVSDPRNGLDLIAAGGESVWAINSKSGSVWRIHPATRRVVGLPIRLGGALEYAAVDRGWLWVVAGGRAFVQAVDPKAHRVVDAPVRRDVDRFRPRFAIADGVLATVCADGLVSAVELKTGHPIVEPVRVTSPSPRGIAGAVAVAHAAIWVCDPREGTVACVDLGTGEVVPGSLRYTDRDPDHKGAALLKVDDGVIWIAHSNRSDVWQLPVPEPYRE